ncbi:hypothetical protein KQI84_15140 [bacterium]|nr:hypothetical protein [bacterium]
MIDRQVTTTDPRRQAWAFLKGLPWRWIILIFLFILLFLLSWESLCSISEVKTIYLIKSLQGHDHFVLRSLQNPWRWSLPARLCLYMAICGILWPKPLPDFRYHRAHVFRTGNIGLVLRLLPLPLCTYLATRFLAIAVDTALPLGIWGSGVWSSFDGSNYWYQILWEFIDAVVEGIVAAGLFFAIQRLFRRRLLIAALALASSLVIAWWQGLGHDIVFNWNLSVSGWILSLIYQIPNLIALEATAILLMAIPSRSRGAKALESAKGPEPNDEQSTQESP